MSQTKNKILVVDDDENLRLILTDKFASVGFNVISAKDGEEGLSKALKEHPDVILLDVIMPKMDGWNVLENLRKDSWGKEAKVVMLTVLEDNESIARAMEGGSFTYLLKTQNKVGDIVDKVREVLM